MWLYEVTSFFRNIYPRDKRCAANSQFEIFDVLLTEGRIFSFCCFGLAAVASSALVLVLILTVNFDF